MEFLLKGSFSCYQLNRLGEWIKENLTTLTIYDKPLYIFDCKISRIAKHKILIESE